MEQDFLTGGNDKIFGNTILSFTAGLESIISRIDSIIKEGNVENINYIKKEKIFYQTVLDKVKSVEE